MSKPATVSASQISDFRLCPRRWWFKSVQKIAEPKTPALIFGDRFAKAVERQLLGQPYAPTGDEATDAAIARMLDAARGFFPAPRPEIRPEYRIGFDVAGAGRMVGAIDVLDLSGTEPKIVDHKTRADRRYAPSVAALATDLQLTIYAKAVQLDFNADRVSVAHLTYVKPPKARAADVAFIQQGWEPEVFLRSVTLDREAVAVTMAGIEADARAMHPLRDPALPVSTIPFDTSEKACWAFNAPCPFTTLCPKLTMPLQRSTGSVPPPPPARAGALPPPPPGRAAAPAPAPAADRGALPPPPPPRPGALPPAPPAKLGEVNPPFEFDDNADEVIAAMGAVPLADIPQLKPAARKRLEGIRITDSIQLAHLTIAYLRAAGVSGAIADEILAVGESFRTLHNVGEQAPFFICPELGEPVASAAEIAAPLASLPDAPPLAAAPIRLTPPPPGAVASAAPAPATERKTVRVHLGNGPAVLYIECQPIRGQRVTLLEDWIAPMLAEVAAAGKVPHYRLIAEYGAASAALARRVQERLGDGEAPEHLAVLFPYSEAAKAVLDLLIAAYPVIIRR